MVRLVSFDWVFSLISPFLIIILSLDFVWKKKLNRLQEYVADSIDMCALKQQKVDKGECNKWIGVRCIREFDRRIFFILTFIFDSLSEHRVKSTLFALRFCDINIFCENAEYMKYAAILHSMIKIFICSRVSQ